MSYPRIRRFVVLLLGLVVTAGCVGVSADGHAASVAAVPAATVYSYPGRSHAAPRLRL